MQSWRKMVVPILASAAGLAAPLAFAVAPSEHAPGMLTSVFQWTVVWAMFTLLIAFVLAAGVFRMTYRYPDEPPGLSPTRALAILVAVIAVCGLSVVPVLLAEVGNAKLWLFGFLIFAMVVAVVLARYWPRASGNRPDGGASV